MENNLKFIWTSDLKSRVYQDLKQVRISVFVTELHGDMATEIHDEEKCKYLAIYENDKCIGGARLLKLNASTMRIQRVAVTPAYRDQGIGHQMLQMLEDECLKSDCQRIEIVARYSAREFYKTLGYQAEGETFIRSGVPHQLLFKNTAN